MARWRLTEAHYINVPGTEWEYSETDRATGRMTRVRFPVPMYLNPNDKADHNYREQEMIVVCHKGKGQPRDLIFEGPPTPAMEPIDDEANKITDALKEQWAKSHPMDNFNIGFGDSLANELAKQMAALNTTLARTLPGTQPVAITQTETAALMDANAALQAQIAELTDRLTALEAQGMSAPQKAALGTSPRPGVARRL